MDPHWVYASVEPDERYGMKRNWEGIEWTVWRPVHQNDVEGFKEKILENIKDQDKNLEHTHKHIEERRRCGSNLRKRCQRKFEDWKARLPGVLSLLKGRSAGNRLAFPESKVKFNEACNWERKDTEKKTAEALFSSGKNSLKIETHGRSKSSKQCEEGLLRR